MSDTLEIESNYDEAEDITFEDYKAVIDQIKCMACSYEASLDDLRLHILSNHLNEQNCDICGKEYKGSANDHCFKHLLIKAITQQKVQCTKCSKLFTTLTKQLNAEGEFLCEKCTLGPTSISTNNRSSDEPNESTAGRIQCDICLKTYAHRKTLTEHIEAIHSGNGLFQCDLCPRVFTYRKNLRSHRRVHTDPVVCEICSYSFSNKNNLARHMLTHQAAGVTVVAAGKVEESA